MKNRSFFSNKYGVEFIDAFIENVINTRLYKLQPQPKYDETMSLMQILDPENGRTYGLKLTPIENGAKLEVRGSFGPFGRTQTWVRVP